jgi:hypothetical protein
VRPYAHSARIHGNPHALKIAGRAIAAAIDVAAAFSFAPAIAQAAVDRICSVGGISRQSSTLSSGQ